MKPPVTPDQPSNPPAGDSLPAAVPPSAPPTRRGAVFLALLFLAIPLACWAATVALADAGLVTGDGSFGLPLGLALSLTLLPFGLRWRNLQRRRGGAPPTDWDDVAKWLLRLDVIALASAATFGAVFLLVGLLVGSI